MGTTQYSQVDILFAFIIKVDSAFAQFGFFGYLIHGGQGKILSREDPLGRVQDFGPSTFFFSFFPLCRSHFYNPPLDGCLFTDSRSGNTLSSILKFLLTVKFCIRLDKFFCDNW